MKAELDRLISGELPYILTGCNALPDRIILMPGSFNPLHWGHAELLRAAEKIAGRPGFLELSVTNVDKPPLDLEDVERRILQLQGTYAVLLTCAPTFAEKAECFPGAWFALGYDTAIRLLSPDYHADIPAMLARFVALETRFIVAGRLHDEIFQGLGQLDVPAGFEDLFIPVPESLFREDISSTKLRGDVGL